MRRSSSALARHATSRRPSPSFRSRPAPQAETMSAPCRCTHRVVKRGASFTCTDCLFAPCPQDASRSRSDVDQAIDAASSGGRGGGGGGGSEAAGGSGATGGRNRVPIVEVRLIPHAHRGGVARSRFALALTSCSPHPTCPFPSLSSPLAPFPLPPRSHPSPRAPP